MKTYDYIIAGGGCAGLSLAYYLSLDVTTSGKSVLVVEADSKQKNDRTWCFWGDSSVPFHSLVTNSWSSLSFIDDDQTHESPLDKIKYQMIRGIDFYEFLHRLIDQVPGFDRVEGKIIDLSTQGQFGTVHLADGRQFKATWVFNSCINKNTQPEDNRHFLLQHFKGWWIKTAKPAFHPDRAVLMDFRARQQNDTRFFYQLPLSENEALIEYTVFSKWKLSPSEYDEALRDYLENTLQLESYEIMEEEIGAIPMTDQKIHYKLSDRVINIGGVGGAIKPSTGYAFLNIQQQTKQIAAQLSRGEVPSSKLESSGRFRFYDSLLLNILQYSGKWGKPIFCRLFRHNKMLRILQFLSEQTRIHQEARIFASLPIFVFLKALFNWKILPSFSRNKRLKAKKMSIQELGIKT